MDNCVTTAPARADRGSHPPEKLTKNSEKPICGPTHPQAKFSSQIPQQIIPFCVKIPPAFQRAGPVSPNPLFDKLTLSHCNSNHSRHAFCHPVPDPLVAILLRPWSSKMFRSAKIDPQGAKMEASSQKGLAVEGVALKIRHNPSGGAGREWNFSHHALSNLKS